MNIAAVFRKETLRLARKEVREVTEGLRKSVTQHRTDIAQLKRTLVALQRDVAALSRTVLRGSTEAAAAVPKAKAKAGAFRLEAVAAMRKRFGISQVELGVLLDVSGQAVSSWESKRVTPKAAVRERIADLRRLNPAQAKARLAELLSAKKKARTKARK